MLAMERIGALLGVFAFLMATIYGFWTNSTELGIEWVGVIGHIAGEEDLGLCRGPAEDALLEALFAKHETSGARGVGEFALRGSQRMPCGHHAVVRRRSGGGRDRGRRVRGG